MSAMLTLMGRFVLFRCRQTILSRRSISTGPSMDNALVGLNADQDKLQKVVQQFAEKELAPYTRDIDRQDHFPQFREFWAKLGQMGLHGITVPSEYGGSGCGYVDHCIVMEELSRASAAIALSYAAHSNLCINQINLYGSEPQKRRYLPKLCSGEHVGALAMSEDNAGSDVLSMQLKAEKRGGGHYLLNGTKFWITNGPVADVFIVYARSRDAARYKPRHITAFIVEKGTQGFQVGQRIDKLGMRGSPTSELIFTDCLVPADNIIGAENNAVYMLMQGLDVERLVLAAGPVGIMKASCDTAFDYAHKRCTFGQVIGKHQLIQGKMADMFVTLSACRSYVYGVAGLLDEPRWRTAEVSKHCAGVILYCAEKATAVALDALQMLGGNGYANDYPAGRLLRDAKLYEIGAGTSEIRRLVIGRALNKQYLHQ